MVVTEKDEIEKLSSAFLTLFYSVIMLFKQKDSIFQWFMTLKQFYTFYITSTFYILFTKTFLCVLTSIKLHRAGNNTNWKKS